MDIDQQKALAIISRVAGNAGEEDFLRELPKHIAYAEDYRRRLALVKDDLPVAQPFAQMFTTHLAILSAGHPNVALEALVPLAIHSVLDSLSYDLDEAIMEFEAGDDAQDRRAISMLTALEIAGQIQENLFPFETNDEVVEAVHTRHTRSAFIRYHTAPVTVFGDAPEQQMRDAVMNTITLSSLLTLEHGNAYLWELIENYAVIGSEAQDEDTAEEAVREAAALQAESLGLPGNETREAMENAVEYAFSGVYGGVSALKDLPAAAMTGEEENATEIAQHLAACAATLLQIGGDVIPVSGYDVHQISEDAAPYIMLRLETRGNVENPSLDLARVALDAAARVARAAYDAQLPDFHDEGIRDEEVDQMMVDMFSSWSPEEVDRIFTSGEVVDQPAFGERIAYRGAFVAAESLSEAALKRLQNAIAKLDVPSTEHIVPSGRLWTCDQTHILTWKEAVQIAKALAAPAGVRYCIVPVTMGNDTMVLFHDGRKHMLLDVFTDEQVDLEDRGSLH